MNHVDNVPPIPPPEEPPAFEAAPVAAQLGPVTETERIVSLDLLRGVALLGIFFVNMQFFTLPLMKAVGMQGMDDPAPGEHLAWAFVKTFCEYKFISMFSLLFGAGLIMQMIRAEASGRGFVPVYLRRMATLAAFGLVHALLLWYGDILFVYACLGTILLLFRKLRPQTLLVVAACALTTGAVMGTGCGAAQVMLAPMAAQGTPAETKAIEATEATEVTEPGVGEPAEDGDATASSDEEPLRGWDAIAAAQADPNRDAWSEGEILAYSEGPFGDALTFRAISFGFLVIQSVLSYGWHVFAMFLTGAALMKLDFFRPCRRRWQTRMCLVGLGIGLPAELAVMWVNVLNDHQMNLTMVGMNFVHEFASVALCLGYVGGLSLLASSGALSGLVRAIGRVGRMALSNYILETLLATSVMYWWGFGRFGSTSRVEGLVLVVSIYAGLILFSAVWLHFMRMGPLEWLWRSLTYARPQRITR